MLFHGAPGSRLFAPPADVTASLGVHLITFDRPGFGGSDRREGRTVLDTAGDVAALADGLSVERFAVLGISAGGAHALGCAVALGERVEFDVTPAVSGDGLFCFALESPSADGVRYNSREAGAGGPEVVVDLVGGEIGRAHV